MKPLSLNPEPRMSENEPRMFKLQTSENEPRNPEPRMSEKGPRMSKPPMYENELHNDVR